VDVHTVHSHLRNVTTLQSCVKAIQYTEAATFTNM